MFKILISAIVAFSFTLPVQAATWELVGKLVKKVEATGTKVIYKECSNGSAGEYTYGNNIDQLVVCTDLTNMNSANHLWETIVHESTHVMQVCRGGPILPIHYNPRMIRELKLFAPHYIDMLEDYDDSHRDLEIEAFWMELQLPSSVFHLMDKNCFYQDSLITPKGNDNSKNTL
tara:strand:+ start:2008 stop:2529 length:522 start_codon:yes stop_codon:yes gene_type:complete